MSEKATNTISSDSNKVLVTQGDSNGIGLEVFFKSFIMLERGAKSHFTLYASKEACKLTLKSIGLPFSIKPDHLLISNIHLPVIWCEDPAYDAYTKAIRDLNKGDVLLTLPASKKSFPANMPGHTSHLRQTFGRNLSMFFSSPSKNVLLLTDHISLDKVESSITPQLIQEQIHNVLIGAKAFLSKDFNKVYFSGINPHAGENGILGNDLALFSPVIKELNHRFKDNEFIGPISGDIIYHQATEHDLLVYSSHDQGLAPFKAMNHFIGANITLGLDFLRLSVDHGTALDMFGLNKANYMGCLYCLELAVKALGRYEKNA